MNRSSEIAQTKKVSAQQKLLDAALKVIRSKGYSATTVDELCTEAGVTKGAFFHHFESKEQLAISAAEYWSKITSVLFEKASYRNHKDPLDRLLGYVDFRLDLIRGKIPEFTCLVGTMVQETFYSSPEIREACKRSIFGHTSEIAKDIVEAKKKYAPHASWKPESLAVYTQAVIQGAFIVSKAKDDPNEAIECISHLRRYIEFLFKPSN
jgi:TetR/AcrR family transcriptional repressor of nem operon